MGVFKYLGTVILSYILLMPVALANTDVSTRNNSSAQPSASRDANPTYTKKALNNATKAEIDMTKKIKGLNKPSKCMYGS